MPFDVELLPAERVVLTRAWGTVTDDDVVGQVERTAALFRDGTIDGDWAQIVDYSAVTDVDGVTSAGVRRAAEANAWPRYAVRAVIVSSDEQFGLARMYQALGGPKTSDLCITRSAAEARAFIASERVRLGIAT